MIELYENDCLKTVSAEGHSLSGKVGENLLCASATVLLRTAAKLLHSVERLEIEGEVDAPGSLFVAVKNVPSEKIGWLQGITDFLLGGLLDLQYQNPKEVQVNLHGETSGSRRMNHGT